jgi:membrane protein DedA with SNARE-associated domain
VESRILALAASPLVYLGMYLFSLIDGIFPPIPSESLAIALSALSASSGQPNLALIILFAATGAFTGDQIAYTIRHRDGGRPTKYDRMPVIGRSTLRAPV